MTRTPDSPKAGDPQPAEKPEPAAGSSAKRQGKDFGLEGTNKTVPVPQDDAAPADELQGTKSKFIPKSPYTRG
jgi:hypothetical protein